MLFFEKFRKLDSATKLERAKAKGFYGNPNAKNHENDHRTKRQPRFKEAHITNSVTNQRNNWRGEREEC